jgi:CubicO group peptidase (beta-lactamase class C family)
VEDYIRFLNAMSKGDVILKKDTIAMMTTNQLTEAQTAAYNNETHAYGLGVRCPKNPDSIYQDSGWDGAAGAFAAFDAKRGITIYYAQHVRGSFPAVPLRHALYAAVRKDLGL